MSESGGVWNQAFEIAPPPSSPAFYIAARLDSVACPAAGSCVAIGEYRDGSEEQQAMVVSESNGVWGQAIKIPGVSLRSIACRAPDACVAIGTARADSAQVMGVSESSGIWGQPQKIALPANDASNYVVELSSLACQTSGPCVAVGEYTDISHHDHAMGMSESNGLWSPASEITLTPNVEGEAHLYSIACPTSGPCVAVGDAYGRSGSLPIDASESGGEWGKANPITQPPGAQLTSISSIACPGSGRCVAIGYDETSSPSSSANAVVVSGSSGTWGQASEIMPPPNGRIKPYAQLQHVACSGARSCVAIGAYNTNSGYEQAMVVDETNGVWGKASEINAPPNASNSQTGYRADLELLACPAFGTCAALGQYDDNSKNAHLMAVATTTAPTVSVSPASSAVTVRKSGWTGVRLSCADAAPCAGSLKLATVKHVVKKRRSEKATILAVSAFAIAPKTTATIKLKLNSVGRALLNTAHRHLRATLTVLETSPAPSQVKTQKILLTRRH